MAKKIKQKQNDSNEDQDHDEGEEEEEISGEGEEEDPIQDPEDNDDDDSNSNDPNEDEDDLEDNSNVDVETQIKLLKEQNELLRQQIVLSQTTTNKEKAEVYKKELEKHNMYTKEIAGLPLKQRVQTMRIISNSLKNSDSKGESKAIGNPPPKKKRLNIIERQQQNGFKAGLRSSLSYSEKARKAFGNK